MNTTFIYSLSCPVTNIVKYIGKSDNIKVRYSKHNSSASKGNSEKDRWIRLLHGKGLKPTIDIIDEVPISEWAFFEKRYISIFKSCGANLVNTQSGGNSGFKHYKRKGISLPWNKGRKGDKVILTEEARINKITALRKANKKCEIVQYSLSGEFIKVWDSANQILLSKEIKATAIDVINSCKGIYTQAGGFMWKYNSGDIKNKIDKHEGTVRLKPVFQKDLNGNVIKQWNSCSEAAKELGFKMKKISLCATGKQIKYEGFKWSYKK